ncbi:hypothetical protein HYX19_02145, partial [Candidatus Woesearchaeota archaeon]|nr:hypothetical protein [Candidatus Woesearchaeota archaeon]
ERIGPLEHVGPLVYDAEEGIIKRYKKINGYDSFLELTINDKTWTYFIFKFDPNNGPEEHITIIQDKNCDGIFETKYDIEDDLKEIKLVPSCYKK